MQFRTPSKQARLAKLAPEQFYHIFNRTNNRETLFYDHQDHRYFLKQYKRFVAPYVHTHAFCLIPNHFHFAIRIKSAKELILLTRQTPEELRTSPQKKLLAALASGTAADAAGNALDGLSRIGTLQNGGEGLCNGVNALPGDFGEVEFSNGVNADIGGLEKSDQMLCNGVNADMGGLEKSDQMLCNGVNADMGDLEKSDQMLCNGVNADMGGLEKSDQILCNGVNADMGGLEKSDQMLCNSDNADMGDLEKSDQILCNGVNADLSGLEKSDLTFDHGVNAMSGGLGEDDSSKVFGVNALSGALRNCEHVLETADLSGMRTNDPAVDHGDNVLSNDFRQDNSCINTSSNVLGHFNSVTKNDAETLPGFIDSEGFHLFHDVVERQFTRLFTAYAMYFNKKYHRSGNLFYRPFKRLHITDERYLRYLIFYIHLNPRNHGVCYDFASFQWSSFPALCSDLPTLLDRAFVLDLFGGVDRFLAFHQADGSPGLDVDMED